MNITENKSPLMCCRACLSTERKLFNIHDFRLADAFSSVLGTSVMKDELPQYLCAYCHTLLLKLTSFKDMCLRTQQSLVLELLKGELDRDCIQRIKSSCRFFNLSITQIEIADSTLPTEEIKVEPNIDIVNIDNIIDAAVLKVEFDESDEVFNDNTSSIPAAKIVKRRKRKCNSVKKKREIEIDFDNDEIDNMSSEENELCPVKKKKENERKTKVKTEEEELKSDGDTIKLVKKVERKKIKNVAKNNGKSASDSAAIESAFAVQIVTLSKEEQLEEIASRKKSRNFLESRYRCEECGKGYDAETAYNNHLLRHSPSSGSLACQICALRFKIKCRLQKHQESHQLKFLCKFGDGCSFVSRDRAHAKNHHAMHAGKTFECQHCGKTFNKSTTYLTHVRLSHPAMNVACDVCGETFVSQKGLRLHQNRMHPDNTKPSSYRCTTCLANLNSVEALNRHTDTAGEHTDLRPCEQCGENCTSETALHAHLKDRHPTETHRCEENAALLRYHQRIHEGVKPFACEQCPKAFTLKSALVWHTRTHTGEKPYQCAECPRAFSSKANFNRHHKTVHLGIRGKFPCNVCGRVFTTSSDARVHVDALHRGLPWPKRDRKRQGNNSPDILK